MISFHHDLDYRMVYVLFPVEGIRFYSQLDGLGDGHESVRYYLYFNCSVFSVHARPDPSSKCCKDGITFDGSRDTGEERINCADIGVVTQIIPLFLVIFGSLCNHVIFNYLPRRHAITCDTHSVVMWHSLQDSFCGRGK